MIGLNSLAMGFVQSGIYIESVTTIMVTKWHVVTWFVTMMLINYVENMSLCQLSTSLRFFVLTEMLHCAIIKFDNVIDREPKIGIYIVKLSKNRMKFGCGMGNWDGEFKFDTLSNAFAP